MPITKAYATIPEIKEYLSQVAGDNTNDKVLGKALARATSMIDEALGFSFGKYDVVTEELSGDYAEGTKVITSWGGAYLQLPPHEVGSEAVDLAVIGPDGETTIPTTEYQEQVDGSLYAVQLATIGQTLYSAGRYIVGWAPGRYTITANWGYGAPPDAIKEVCLELAVNIWRGRDRGMWTDVVGVEGSGGLRFTGGLTNQQRAIIESVYSRYTSEVVV